MSNVKHLIVLLSFAGVASVLHAADLDFSIANISVDAAGGSFDVILTPSSDVIDLGSFGANLTFSNFEGVGPVTLNGFSNPILPLDNIQSNPNLSSYPLLVNAGDSIFVKGIAAGTLPDITTAGATLVTVYFSASFDPGSNRFDVSLVPGDPIFSPTDITAGNGPHQVSSLGNATITVPDLFADDFEAGNTIAWSSTVPCNLAHDVCNLGDPLDSAESCDPCVASVCVADAFCCEVSWDRLCIEAAEELCGQCP
jgi:hypothetical protein